MYLNYIMKRKFILFKIFIFFVIIILYNICYFSVFGAINKLDLNCGYGIAMDFDSGNILYNNNMYEKIYPASTTKILTAILTIENLDLSKTITVSNNAVDSTPEGSSVMGVKKDEIFTVEELLYGLMLPSGNDAAIVLAEAVSGNSKSFVNLMNQKLQDIGCYNTHFTNPHGFHDDNHYSTPYDMAKLFRYCLQDDIFTKIIGTYQYEIDKTNITDKKRIFTNTNKLLHIKNANTYYGFVKGGKTGYTDEAKNTLISYGIKDDKTVIVGTFKGILDSNRVPYTYSDSKKIYEYCFENYYLGTIAKSSDYTFKVRDDLNYNNYTLQLEKDITALTNENDILYTTYNLNIDYDKIEKLIKEKITDKNVGNIEINYISNEKEYSDTYNLKFISYESDNNIVKFISNNTTVIIIFLISVLLVLILIYFIIKNKNKHKHKNKHKYKYNHKFD